jgi:hypothetical protein
VTGHADLQERELTREERLNIVAYLLADETRANARGPYGARPNCPRWPVEKATLFIEGTKMTSGMKQQLSSQLSDGKLKDYIIDKEKWTQYTFNSIAWRDYETVSKNRQVNISKACFNMWHTGRNNLRYYGGNKSCYMCSTEEEDWIHILTCQLIEACMNMGELWAKASKAMKNWKTSKQMDCNGEKFTRIHTQSKVRGDQHKIPRTYDNRRNQLNLAFREQDTIGWDNLLKGWMGGQWTEYVKQHIQNENVKLQAKEWALKMILAPWDHMLQLW